MYRDIHREFLKLIGMDEQEASAFLPAWKKAAKFLKLKDEDVQFAVESWIPTYWDLSLEGVKKLICICIREIVEFSKFKQYTKNGDKLLYVNVPSVNICIYANKLSGKGHLHIAYPGYLITLVLGAFFNKRYYENCHGMTGEGEGNDCAHCKMNCTQTRVIMDGAMPFPDVAVNWGLKCDEAPKTDELLSCLSKNKWHNIYITVPHDLKNGTVECNDRGKIRYLAEKLRQAQSEITKRTGFQVTEEELQRSVDDYMSYMYRVERLTDMVMNANPVPLTGNELTLCGIGIDLCFNTDYRELFDAIDTVIAEVEARIASGYGVLPKDSPRLACQFNPLYAPWLDRAFKEQGICLAQGRMFPFAEAFEQFLREERDVYSVIARIALSIPSGMNFLDEVRINSELLERYPVDGALYGAYSFDRWVGSLHKLMVRTIEEKTGIPHFYMEGDLWDGQSLSSEDRKSVIGSICNYLKITTI